ncbi:MAG: hypothetical protein ABIR98_08800 [Usitatibacter sp.]
MKSHRILAMLPLFVSAAALAQAYYPDPHPLYDGALTRDELRECMYRDESLAARQERIERDKAAADAETDAVAQAGTRLADELRDLDNGNLAAVASYNARSAEHNRWVHNHNRRIAELNARTASLNGDSARLDTLCARSYYPSDRDAILIERSRTR